ncbi:MAG: M20/M25/M40 family metallo-hydrolase [Bacteroidales bacterium]
MNKQIILATSLIIIIFSACKPHTPEKTIDKIYKEALSDSMAYQNLQYLSDSIGGRLACSEDGIRAVYWAQGVMKELQPDTVFLQELKVKNWKRGKKEKATLHSSKYGKKSLNVTALGRGIGTNGKPLSGEIIEVNSLEELSEMDISQTEGKIIFFNDKMSTERKNTFQAYGEVAGQRFYGPIKAAEYKAKGAIIRSITTSIDTFPHTGVTKYAEPPETVPAVAVATQHADQIHKWLSKDNNLTVSYTTYCKNRPDTTSYNVVGEIRGKKYPNKIITVGGHLDSWDISDGAHDDGAGCMQAMEVIRIFKKLGIKPNHTIRAVMFMDEEISQMGGEIYAEEAKRKGETHIFALESDRGATKPLGFSIDASDSIRAKLQNFKPLLKPYGIEEFKQGGGGVDIGPLKEFNTPLVGFVTDSENYFDWHHSPNDTFDKIDFEDFQSGSAAITSLIYLVDRYGLEDIKE